MKRAPKGAKLRSRKWMRSRKREAEQCRRKIGNVSKYMQAVKPAGLVMSCEQNLQSPGNPEQRQESGYN